MDNDMVYINEFIGRLHTFFIQCGVNYTLDYTLEKYKWYSHSICVDIRSDIVPNWPHDIRLQPDYLISIVFKIDNYDDGEGGYDDDEKLHNIGISIYCPYSQDDIVPVSRDAGDDITRLNGEYYADFEIDMIAQMKANNLLE